VAESTNTTNHRLLAPRCLELLLVASCLLTRSFAVSCSRCLAVGLFAEETAAMDLPLIIVDAFANVPFEGNQAAICWVGSR